MVSTDTKTIALSKRAYDLLAAKKREGESFNDVVKRLAGDRSLLDMVGTGDADDDYYSVPRGCTLAELAEEVAIRRSPSGYINPVIAAVIMVISSLTVVANSGRRSLPWFGSNTDTAPGPSSVESAANNTPSSRRMT